MIVSVKQFACCMFAAMVLSMMGRRKKMDEKKIDDHIEFCGTFFHRIAVDTLSDCRMAFYFVRIRMNVCVFICLFVCVVYACVCVCIFSPQLYWLICSADWLLNFSRGWIDVLCLET